MLQCADPVRPGGVAGAEQEVDLRGRDDRGAADPVVGDQRIGGGEVDPGAAHVRSPNLSVALTRPLTWMSTACSPG